MRAVRILFKSEMDEMTTNRFITEVLLLINLDHPSIIRFCEIFRDEEYYYIVSELCYGGELIKEIENHVANEYLMPE